MSRRGLPTAAAGIPAPADKRFRRSDVRLGSRKSWRGVGRRALWFSGGALLVLILAGLAGNALLGADALRVNRHVVRGNVQFGASDIDERLSGLVGENILRVDLEQYRLRLLESPWVASAELWRVLPDTVQVRIVERVPLAIARIQGQMYLVDEGGVIIEAFGPQHQQFDLPIVDGLIAHGSSPDVADPARIRLVRRLFTEVAAREDLFRRISQVNVSNPRNAVVLLDGEPAALHLGDREFVARLERYELLATTLREKPPQEYYLLRFGDSTYVK